jgi:hypothetical protein
MVEEMVVVKCSWQGRLSSPTFLSSEIGTVGLGVSQCRLRGVNAMIDRYTFVGYTPVVHLRTLSTDEPVGWLGGFKTVACWHTRGIASTRGGQEKRH